MNINKTLRPKQRRSRKQHKDPQTFVGDVAPTTPVARLADTAVVDGNPSRKSNPPRKTKRANPRRRQAMPPGSTVSSPPVAPVLTPPTSGVPAKTAPPATIVAAQPRNWQYLTRAGRLFLGHPRAVGLAITIVLSCVTFALAVTLSRMPSFGPVNAVSEGDTAASQVPQLQAARPTPVQSHLEPAIAQAGAASPGIRIIDLSVAKPGSCQDDVWPYIDPQCRAAVNDQSADRKDARTARKTETKIGPRPIDARSPSNPSANAQAKDIPIGSMTAIIPASPKVAATDGVATREIDEPADEPRPAAIVQPKETTPSKPAADTMKIRKSASRHRLRANTAATKTEQPQSVDRKKKRPRQVMEARRKPSSRRTISEIREPAGTPRFFFPFGWFTQLR